MYCTHCGTQLDTGARFCSNCGASVISQRTHISDIRDDFAKFGGIDAEMLTLDFMEGHDFELWCANALRDMGFEDVEVTPGSGDQGVDILAAKDGLRYAIQCKRYTADLGNAPVQEVHAGKYLYRCHVASVITNRYFTPGAIELASATGVLLWDRDWILRYLQSKLDPSGSLEISHSTYSGFHDSVLTDPDIVGDEMLPAAMDVFFETGQASVSMLQRRLKIGYASAARIVDEMEEKGLVGPFQGSKPRAILVTKEQWEAMQSGELSFVGDLDDDIGGPPPTEAPMPAAPNPTPTAENRKTWYQTLFGAKRKKINPPRDSYSEADK